MLRTTIVSLFWSVILFLISPFLQQPSPQASSLTVPTGQISGSVDFSATVTGQGGVIGTIADINISPGTGGIQPSLSIVVNSQGANSLLGVGAGLSGLGAISRGSSTIAQDLLPDGVDFDANDQLYWEGRRLILVSGTHGQSGASYRTEQESFARIKLNGSLSSSNSSFTIETKAGIKLTYGGTSNSQIKISGQTAVYIWAQNRMEDTKGNYATFSYNNNGSGEYQPKQIDYTANDAAGLSAYNSVKFTYENRADVSDHYTAGSLVQGSKRLKQIVAYHENTPIWTYNLKYKYSVTTGRSHLVEVQKCGLGNVCFNPNKIEWQEALSDVQYVPTTGIPCDPSKFNFTKNGQGTTWNNGYTNNQSNNYVYDFDGDGYSDMITHVGLTSTTPTTQWRISYSTGSSFDNRSVLAHNAEFTQNGQPIHTLNGVRNAYFADLNDDGHCDMIKYGDTPLNPDGKWRVYFANNRGQNFTDKGFWNGHDGGAWSKFISQTYKIPNAHFQDVSGDRKADLIRYKSTNQWEVWKSTGSSFGSTPTIWTGHNGGNQVVSGKLNTFWGDFNNDNIIDLMKYADSNSGLWHVWTSTGSNFQDQGLWAGHTGGVGNCFVADANGDGYDDIIKYKIAPSNLWEVWLNNKAKSFVYACDWPAHTGGPANNFVGDFDKDGKDDLCAKATPLTGNNWRICLSSGGTQNIDPSDPVLPGDYNFTTPVNQLQGIGYDPSQQEILSSDFNGDGRTDVLRYNSNGKHFLWLSNPSSNVAYTACSLSTDPALSGIYNSGYDPAKTQIQTGDFDGTGKIDVLRLQSNGDHFLGLAKNNGVGFTGFPTVTGLEGVGFLSDPSQSHIFCSDFNADGLSDIYHWQYNGQNNWLALSSYDANQNIVFQVFGNAQLGALNQVGFSSDIKNERVLAADVNADGLTDLVHLKNQSHVCDVYLAYAINNFQISFTKKSSTLGSVSSGNLYSSVSEEAYINIADFNGDGLQDVINIQSDGNNHWIAYSKGDGTFDFRNSLTGLVGVGFATGSPKTQFQIFDSNGDGRSDILCIQSDGTHYLAYARGMGKFALLNHVVGIQYHGFSLADNSSHIIAGNFNEDAKLDILNFQSDGNHWLGLSKGFTQGLITAITGGNGERYEFEYKPLTDNSVYTKDNDATYPRYDIESPIYVVSAMRSTNGMGGMRTITYEYGGMEMNLRGRGIRGFRWTKATDSETGIYTYTESEQDYRYEGASTLKIQQRLSNGTLISEVVNDTAFIRYGFSHYFSYTASSVETKRELNGDGISKTTTTTEYDNYGNPTKVVKNLGGGFVSTIECVYKNDTINKWHLGRLLESKVTETAPGKPNSVKNTKFEYDPTTGLLVKEIIYPDNPTFLLQKTYTHDVFGNVLTSTTTAGGISRKTQSTYDSKGRFELETKNDLNHTAKTTYEAERGLPLTKTDANGFVVTLEYDPFGRLVKSVRPDGSETVKAYLKCQTGDCPTGAVYYEFEQSTGSVSARAYYDVLHRQLRGETVGFGGQKIFVDTKFNSKGEVTDKSDPYFEGQTAYWTKYEYDILGRNIKETAPDGAVSTAQHLSRSGSANAFTGVKVVAKNPLNQTTTQILNERGNLLTTTDFLGGVVTNDYDAAGQLISKKDAAGNETKIEYDLRGQKTKLIDPNTGTTTYEYNGFSELTRQVDAKGQEIKREYDVLGRLAKQTEPEGIIVYTYDQGVKAIGKPTKTVRSDGYQEDLTYDNLGRLKSHSSKETASATPSIYQLQYDAISRLETTVYPDSFKVKNVYNDNGFLEKVVNPDSISTHYYWKADQFNARGQIEKSYVGSGLLTQHTYEATSGYLQEIKTSSGIPAIPAVQHLSVKFDLLANLTERKDILRSVTEQFTYDGLNRLTKAQVVNGAAQTVAYNAIGNITSKSDVGSYTYGQNGAGVNAVTATSGIFSAQYTYDAVGNRLTGGGQTLAYTSFNVPYSIKKGNTELRFAYDPGHSRYRETELKDGKVVKVKRYIGGAMETDSSASGEVKRHFIMAGGQTVAVHTVRGKGQDCRATVEYLHRDHLGSVQTVTDEQGKVVEVLSFDAWGKRRSIDWKPIAPVLGIYSQNCPRGFTGHEHLDEVGLIHMNGRVYDPLLGRFLSADPFVQSPDATQSLNRYTYVNNNPLSFTDPSGFFIKKLFHKAGKWLKENWRTVAQIAVVAVVGWATFGLAAGTVGVAIQGAAAGAAGAFTGTLLAGGSISDALKAGIKAAPISALRAVMTYGVAEWLGHETDLINFAPKMVAHGVVQGVVEQLQGGKFKHGYLAGMASVAGEYLLGDLGAIIAGGTAAEMGGGKFSNGAMSALFTLMFNDWLTPAREERIEQVLTLKYFTTEDFLGQLVVHPLAIPAEITAAVWLAGEVGVGTALGWIGRSAWGLVTRAFGVSRLNVRPDIVLSGGRNGSNVKNLIGPPNSAVKGGAERMFITDSNGRVVLDVTSQRAKMVFPDKGFGSKMTPTREQIQLLNRLHKE